MFTQKRQKTWAQRACEAVLTTGPVPQHVAIIMDGNRRFAAKKSLAKSEGHVKGFDKLAETLEWCLDLGISEVTVYAFSIENFKRSADEVACLMELSRQKFAKLLQERDLIHQHGVCVRIIGNISLLPKDLQELLAEAVCMSAHNKRAILNVCFAYTARDDMCMAMQELAVGVKEGDISESLFEKCLYTCHCRNVDLLIRTSGEVRLSDFLLWESSFSCLAFVKVLWPEFSIWHLYAAILHYQRNCSKIQIVRQSYLIERERLQREADFACVVEESNMEKPPNHSGADKSSHPTSFNMPAQKNIQSCVQQYAAEREQRTQAFLACLYRRREDYIKSLLPAHPLMGSKPALSVTLS
ncbi:unnamed protein product [Candidula unifasciata]|uniref:Alkyl transferase n=1 Tax=Candidula unifasciata TaxID=100452 RepID=A0A8S3YT82_9EUPU|nr:unnamed protein product [Candidula unifasciata]